MRPRVGLIAFLVLVVPLTLRTRLAAATDCAGTLNPCVNDDDLWPHAGPSQFASIGSDDTLSRDRLGFGLVTSYLSRPITLRLRSPGKAEQSDAVDNQVNGTFLWSYGVAPRLELDLAMPLTFGQSGAGLAPITGGAGLNDTAVRDMRFGFTYNLTPLVGGESERQHATHSANTRSPWGLAARFEVSAPTGDRDQFAGERTGVFVPSLSAAYRWNEWFAGAELGVRIRPTAELLGARVGTQLVTALGAGADILPRGLFSVELEAWALPVLVGQDDIVFQNGAYTNRATGHALVPAEWELSARTAPLGVDDLAIQLGGGGSLPLSGDNELSPRFRFTLSVRWAP